jgi:hypothetical protein
VLKRLRTQVPVSLAPELQALVQALESYLEPAPGAARRPSQIFTLTIISVGGPLSFFTTTTLFGTPVEVTLY